MENPKFSQLSCENGNFKFFLESNILKTIILKYDLSFVFTSLLD